MNFGVSLDIDGSLQCDKSNSDQSSHVPHLNRIARSIIHGVQRKVDQSVLIIVVSYHLAAIKEVSKQLFNQHEQENFCFVSAIFFSFDSFYLYKKFVFGHKKNVLNIYSR